MVKNYWTQRGLVKKLLFQAIGILTHHESQHKPWININDLKKEVIRYIEFNILTFNDDEKVKYLKDIIEKVKNYY